MTPSPQITSNDVQTHRRDAQTIHLPIPRARVVERTVARKIDIWTSANRSADARTSHIFPNMHISWTCYILTARPRGKRRTPSGTPTIRARRARRPYTPSIFLFPKRARGGTLCERKLDIRSSANRLRRARKLDFLSSACRARSALASHDTVQRSDDGS